MSILHKAEEAIHTFNYIHTYILGVMTNNQCGCALLYQVVYRTYGTLKTLYISLVSPTLSGHVYLVCLVRYCMPPRNSPPMVHYYTYLRVR